MHFGLTFFCENFSKWLNLLEFSMFPIVTKFDFEKDFVFSKNKAYICGTC